MERIILHSDLNNFFASVECVENSEYKDKLIAVCGSQDDRHGIVLAKNENAKKFGVKTGETAWQAKEKCPDLILIPPHFEKYKEYSNTVRDIYNEYTDETEPFGMDECWLDVSRSTSLFGSGKTIADAIRSRVKHETGLTVSVGVSFNKVFAKLCSDMKKPDAVTEVGRESFKEKIWPLPADALIGVGRSAKQVLYRRGIRTIGDIAALPCGILESWLGKRGALLYMFANGMDNSKVSPTSFVPTPKSISRGVTCREDLRSGSEVSKVLLYLCENISHSLREQHLNAGGISVNVKLTDLSSNEYAQKLSFPTRTCRSIFAEAMKLFNENHSWKNNVRALTVCVSRLCDDAEPIKFDFFIDAARERKIETKEACTDIIRERFGSDAVIPASLLGDFKLPRILNKSEMPHSPFI